VARALVTGAAGFIGANLARRLLRDGHETHLAVRKTSKRWRLEDVDAPLHELDLGDAGAVQRVVTEARPEWVFHAAAHGGSAWQTDPHEIFRSNVEGTINLVRACAEAGVGAFVNTGTSSEYGFKDHAPSEDEPLEPNSDYAVAKAAATLYCGYAARELGLRAVTLRLYSAYGPWEEPRRLVPTLVLHALRGTLPPLVSPTVARDFVYVDDVLDAYLLAAERGAGGAVYNVGTGTQTTIADAVEIVCNVLGVDAEPDWGSMPERSWDTNVWVADSSRIQRELGWRPRHAFEDGIRRTADWFRSLPQLAPVYR
jgi:nucleoside-diphosphate-sugar epimerase